MQSFPILLQWLILLIVSLALGFVLQYHHVVAALFVGPMVVGLVMALCGARIKIAPQIFMSCQSIIGCMISGTLSFSVLSVLIDNWFLITLTLVMTLLSSGLSGWLLFRFSNLPGSTGIWGSLPGGASAMVLMSGDFGADMRLVAFMQYLRVLFVVTMAAVVVRIVLGNHDKVYLNTISWFPPLDHRFVATLVVAIMGMYLGRRFRIPAGAMLMPMIIGAVLNTANIVTLQVPEWLLALAYAFIGWSIGLRFTPAIVLLALKTLPQILASIIALMLICGAMAWLMTLFLPVDMLTAYLATSPGGLDTVAIILTGSKLNSGFVMAMQSLRLLTILIIGPLMARFISRIST
ncbi:Putative transport protein [Liberibacter crescens BT-1]|uniref:Putative transport protein n=1 Tax=Liberibacter crescens (strain BT-1) TaxID=1215343 RepID=L0ESS2_LIBCB|nr:AbrB family transcriptional regulator [Liberibacter crescens]AGA64554.1 Putative transport protein [Liberibacter crescens BT-1]AMC12697.1 AbrB family transcriptional regulator [Liberibacter crescens]